LRLAQPLGARVWGRHPARKGLADDRVAIADAGVPAGEYARQALERLGLLGAYRPHLVGQKDVRAVLNAVEQGEMQAGFVYATDARVSKVSSLRFDPKSQPISTSRWCARRHRRRHRFVEFLRGEAARGVLLRAGFALP
jgi:molybdate transport system substrate-binding protein